MLEYYFDFLLHFIHRKYFQCVQSDTDSLYMAFSSETLADSVKPHMRCEYFENLHHWLPLDVCAEPDERIRGPGAIFTGEPL